ncbi:MAG: cobyric acid synthase [Actinomycetota bacterium]|nr:cobyric acid synthase [Actinomycetota bacterium]
MAAKGLAVLGTGSDVGKSTVVAGLCRVLSDAGVSVAPFKAQNMALNSYVTEDGGEIGRAQAFQAAAARVRPEVGMNPVLLKPTGDRSSQVIVMGRATQTMEARQYYESKSSLRPVIEGALDGLRSRFDAVVVEGAGSTAEINLLEQDSTNITLARRMGIPAVLVGDIDRGGVFASLYGTIALLPEELAAGIGGYIINKFRGDPALLDPGVARLEALTGRRCYGVLPYRSGAAIDGEDSLDVGVSTRGEPGGLEVAVVALPRISNYTDVDPLRFEPDISLRWVRHPAELGEPDLVVLPGTKATVGDLAWLRESGWADSLARHRDRGGHTLGICGGYQMLGSAILDSIESGVGEVAGLGWIGVRTEFQPRKVVRRRQGFALGHPVAGYQIHHGRVLPEPGAPVWLAAGEPGAEEAEGVADRDGRTLGTTLHGVFESDAFRGAFFAELARRRGRRFRSSGIAYAQRREDYIDELADALRAHLDLEALWRLMEGGGTR